VWLPFLIEVNLKSIKVFYWVAFGLSVVILPQNFGLGLIALGIPIILILILHIGIGLNMDRLQNYQLSLVVSAVNLLLFVLIRPDGAHAFNETGLSASLEMMGIHLRISPKYEDLLFLISMVLLILQTVFDIRLLRISRKLRT